jgi:toxin YoeB
MNKLFSNTAWNDYLYWDENDKAKKKRIQELIKSIEREGYSKGIGKPEALKHQYRGLWSRRINDEHRLIYSVDNENIIIYSCRNHY